MTNTTKLLPCPFCGGVAEIDSDGKNDRTYYWWVSCQSEKCEYGFLGGQRYDSYDGMETSPWATEAEAITAWNTRPAPPNEAELVEIVTRVLVKENFDRASYYSDMAKGAITALRPYLNDGKRVAELEKQAFKDGFQDDNGPYPLNSELDVWEFAWNSRQKEASQ